jgi:hypothetical protein
MDPEQSPRTDGANHRLVGKPEPLFKLANRHDTVLPFRK